MNSASCIYRTKQYEPTDWQGTHCFCSNKEKDCPYFKDESIGRCPHLFKTRLDYMGHIFYCMSLKCFSSEENVPQTFQEDYDYYLKLKEEE